MRVTSFLVKLNNIATELGKRLGAKGIHGAHVYPFEFLSPLGFSGGSHSFIHSFIHLGIQQILIDHKQDRGVLRTSISNTANPVECGCVSPAAPGREGICQGSRESLCPQHPTLQC